MHLAYEQNPGKPGSVRRKYDQRRIVLAMSPRLGSRWCCRRTTAVRAAHELEEIAVRLQDHHVLTIAERRAVGFHTAPERGELRIASKRIGVDICGAGIALTLDLLRIAVGIGQHDFTLTIGIGADLFTLGGTGRT